MTGHDSSVATPLREQSGPTMRRDRRLRRLRCKTPAAGFSTTWEPTSQRSWSSSSPLERTEWLALEAHNRCRVLPRQPRSTRRMEYRYPDEWNDERESPQNVRRSELDS